MILSRFYQPPQPIKPSRYNINTTVAVADNNMIITIKMANRGLIMVF